MKPKKCRVCKSEFTPIYTTSQSVCSLKCAVVNAEVKKSKAWNERKKVLKDELTTVQDLMKVAQQVFNKYIRLRDEGNLCFSCGKIPKKGNAGHFYSAGGHFNVRFDERNVHLQCEYCNSFLSGNLLPYRENLLVKLGYEEFESLSNDAMKTRKFTREELKEIIEKYKQKIKDFKN
jgi:hypothetical protein